MASLSAHRRCARSVSRGDRSKPIELVVQAGAHDILGELDVARDKGPIAAGNQRPHQLGLSPAAKAELGEQERPFDPDALVETATECEDGSQYGCSTGQRWNFSSSLVVEQRVAICFSPSRNT